MVKTTKGGRPPKPARLKRTRRLQLLLTEAERKALNQYAAKRNITVSDLIRSCIRKLMEETNSVHGKKGDMG